MSKKTRYNARMIALQLKHEKKIQTKIRQWLEFSKTEIVKGINKQMIRKDQADTIVMELTDWIVIENNGVTAIKPAILYAIAEVGQEGYKVGGIKLAFDMLHPSTVELAQTITADLVREVTEETKDAIRWAIRDGANKGKSMQEIGKRIKPLVGLTQKQVIAVANKEEAWLTEVNAQGKLRFNREQIDRKVARYENRLHRRRAKTISRTETARTVDAATLLAYEEAGIDAEWVTRGELACDICAANEGKIYTVSEARGLLPAHPN